jgi:hypothetical protein
MSSRQKKKPPHTLSFLFTLIPLPAVKEKHQSEYSHSRNGYRTEFVNLVIFLSDTAKMILQTAYHCIDIDKTFWGLGTEELMAFFSCLQKTRELSWFDNPTYNE